MDLTSAAIATLTATLINTIVTLCLFRKTDEKRLHDQLNDILKLSVQYPYLENRQFISKWRARDEADENYIRYDNYCTLVFNFLARLAEHYKYDPTKIGKFVNAKDWMRLHRLCGEHPSTEFENADGYEKQFRDLITEYLK